MNKEIDPAFERRARIILENIEAFPGMKVLDIGCGRGFYTMALAQLYPKLQITAIDSNKEYLKKAENYYKDAALGNKVVFKFSNAKKLPFSDKSFDRIVISEVLEHVPDDNQVLKEIFRVLKPGGLVLISVPCSNYPLFWDPINYLLEHIFKKHIPSHIWWLAGIWADHLRLYTEEELIGKVEKTGFKINKIWKSTFYCLPFSHFLLYGVGKNLVEKGLVSQGFNRFQPMGKMSPLVSLTKKLFLIFDQFNDRPGVGKRYVNLILQLSKNN